MPQPKTSKSSRKAKPPAEPEAGDETGAREALARLLNPLDLVLLTRDRLQDVLDDAVARGRMTRMDATDLMTELISRGRRTTADVLADAEQLLGRSREGVEGAGDRVLREVDRARRVTGLGPSFPILDYDDLTAAQVTSRLADLTPAQLRKVRDYERRNANRKSVLAAIDAKLG